MLHIWPMLHTWATLHTCITFCLVWGVKPSMRDEGRSYSKWRNAPQSSVADVLDLNMIGHKAFICFVACIYIDLQTRCLLPSCIEMLDWWPEYRGPHSLESVAWLGEWPCTHCFENSIPCAGCPLLLSKQGSVGRNGRPTTFGADRPSVSSQWFNVWLIILFPWPVDLNCGRWHSTILRRKRKAVLETCIIFREAR